MASQAHLGAVSGCSEIVNPIQDMPRMIREAANSIPYQSSGLFPQDSSKLLSSAVSIHNSPFLQRQVIAHQVFGPSSAQVDAIQGHAPENISTPEKPRIFEDPSLRHLFQDSDQIDRIGNLEDTAEVAVGIGGASVFPTYTLPGFEDMCSNKDGPFAKQDLTYSLSQNSFAGYFCTLSNCGTCNGFETRETGRADGVVNEFYLSKSEAAPAQETEDEVCKCSPALCLCPKQSHSGDFMLQNVQTDTRHGENLTQNQSYENQDTQVCSGVNPMFSEKQYSANETYDSLAKSKHQLFAQPLPMKMLASEKNPVIPVHANGGASLLSAHKGLVATREVASEENQDNVTVDVKINCTNLPECLKTDSTTVNNLQNFAFSPSNILHAPRKSYGDCSNSNVLLENSDQLCKLHNGQQVGEGKRTIQESIRSAENTIITPDMHKSNASSTCLPVQASHSPDLNGQCFYSERPDIAAPKLTSNSCLTQDQTNVTPQLKGEMSQHYVLPTVVAGNPVFSEPIEISRLTSNQRKSPKQEQREANIMDLPSQQSDGKSSFPLVQPGISNHASPYCETESKNNTAGYAVSGQRVMRSDCLCSHDTNALQGQYREGRLPSHFGPCSKWYTCQGQHPPSIFGVGSTYCAKCRTQLEENVCSHNQQVLPYRDNYCTGDGIGLQNNQFNTDQVPGLNHEQSHEQNPCQHSEQIEIGESCGEYFKSFPTTITKYQISINRKSQTNLTNGDKIRINTSTICHASNIPRLESHSQYSVRKLDSSGYCSSSMSDRSASEAISSSNSGKSSSLRPASVCRRSRCARQAMDRQSSDSLLDTYSSPHWADGYVVAANRAQNVCTRRNKRKAERSSSSDGSLKHHRKRLRRTTPVNKQPNLQTHRAPMPSKRRSPPAKSNQGRQGSMRTYKGRGGKVVTRPPNRKNTAARKKGAHSKQHKHNWQERPPSRKKRKPYQGRFKEMGLQTDHDCMDVECTQSRQREHRHNHYEVCLERPHTHQAFRVTFDAETQTYCPVLVSHACTSVTNMLYEADSVTPNGSCKITNLHNYSNNMLTRCDSSFSQVNFHIMPNSMSIPRRIETLTSAEKNGEASEQNMEGVISNTAPQRNNSSSAFRNTSASPTPFFSTHAADPKTSSDSKPSSAKVRALSYTAAATPEDVPVTKSQTKAVPVTNSQTKAVPVTKSQTKAVSETQDSGPAKSSSKVETKCIKQSRVKEKLYVGPFSGFGSSTGPVESVTDVVNPPAKSPSSSRKRGPTAVSFAEDVRPATREGRAVEKTRSAQQYLREIAVCHKCQPHLEGHGAQRCRPPPRMVHPPWMFCSRRGDQCHRSPHRTRSTICHCKESIYEKARHLLKQVCYLKNKEETLFRGAVRCQRLRMQLQEQHSLLFVQSDYGSDNINDIRKLVTSLSTAAMEDQHCSRKMRRKRRGGGRRRARRHRSQASSRPRIQAASSTSCFSVDHAQSPSVDADVSNSPDVASHCNNEEEPSTSQGRTIARYVGARPNPRGRLQWREEVEDAQEDEESYKEESYKEEPDKKSRMEEEEDGRGDRGKEDDDDDDEDDDDDDGSSYSSGYEDEEEEGDESFDGKSSYEKKKRTKSSKRDCESSDDESDDPRVSGFYRQP